MKRQQSKDEGHNERKKEEHTKQGKMNQGVKALSVHNVF